MARPSGVVNPIYESTFVFTNDFPALLEDEPQPEESFVKTKVDSYLGFTTPLGLATPGHSGCLDQILEVQIRPIFRLDHSTA